GRVGHLALGVHVAMPHAARRDAIDQLDAGDLDHAVAVERVEPRRLRIEHDLAQSWSSLNVTTFCHSHESGNPAVTGPPYLGGQRWLDCPVEPGNDKTYLRRSCCITRPSRLCSDSISLSSASCMSARLVPLSTTYSARARRSASVSCRASRCSSLSTVMPGRASTRSLCTC